MRALPGAPVVLSETSDELWHLPSSAGRSGATLCGLVGLSYVYGELIARRRLCSVCRERAPQRDVVWNADGQFVAAPKPKRQSARRVPQFTEAQVQLLHQMYVEKTIGTPALAELVWEKLGFRNRESCANAIFRAFVDRGLPLRARADSHRRTEEGRRLIGYGGQRPGEKRLDARTVDRLWTLYLGGHTSREICERFHARYGYADRLRFRNVLEYAWKTSGRRLRTNSEAELLSRSKMPARCPAMKTGSDGRRPRPCTQRPLKGSIYCLHHDPAHQEAVLARAAALRARKTLKARIPWADVLAHLEPLLQPQADRFGRHLEKAPGALARHTGIDPAITSRLLKGRHETITVDYANRMLAPLGLTVDDIQSSQLQRAA